MQLFAVMLVSAVLFAAPQLLADTIVLNSGEKLQGEVISDTGTNAVEIRVWNESRTINSVRAIPPSEVKSIEHETPDQKAQRLLREAFQNTQRCRLGPASFPLEYYDQVIKNTLRSFLVKYPNSSLSNEVTTAIEEWTAEREQVNPAFATGGETEA